MMRGFSTWALALRLLVPPAAFAQAPGPTDSFRPYLFVLLAFAAGWILIAAWVYRIGRKVRQLSDEIGEASAEE